MSELYSFQEEFANSNKNFRYIIGNKRCGKTTAAVKAVCNLALIGQCGIILDSQTRLQSIKKQVIDTLNHLGAKSSSSSNKITLTRGKIHSNIQFYGLENFIETRLHVEWIWLNRTNVNCNERIIWDVLLPRILFYPRSGTLLITEEKTLLNSLFNKEEYNMVLMNWEDLLNFE